jgi:hypothetical protein
LRDTDGRVITEAQGRAIVAERYRHRFRRNT